MIGYTSQDEYLLKANALINSGDSAVLIKYRANGDKLCYNTKTNEFAVVNKNGIIRTYFKPKYGIDYFNNL